MSASFVQRFDPLPALFDDFTALLRSLTPDEAEARVPGMAWTAGEVGAHVLTVLRRYLGPTERAATRARLAELNDEDIAAARSSSVDVADEIDRVMEVLSRVAPDVPLDVVRPFHLGLEVTVAAGWANLIGELVAHGHDISAATGRTWSIDGSLLEGIWRELLPAAAGWLRPEARNLDELYLLRLPFGEVLVHLDAGRVVVADPPAFRPPDHVVDAADAEDFTLQFPYRRRLITEPTTALLASRFTDI